MEPPKYRRKWEELNRAFNRLEQFYLGVIDQQDSFQGPKDFVLNFFRVSYELKESLKKTSGIIGLDGYCGEVESFVNSNQYISLGLDIANQEKHVSLKDNRSKQTIGIINSHVHILDPNGKDRTELTIEINSVPKDCLRIARENIEAWKIFLTSKNLV